MLKSDVLRISLFVLLSTMFLVTWASADGLVGDLSEDYSVDLEDLLALAGQWLDEFGCVGHPDDCADLVGNNGVDLADFAVVSANWLDTANLKINEFMSSNYSTIDDDEGDFDDWIEIYNSENGPVDIGGMYLTDDLENPTKWRIPDDAPTETTIGPHGYLLIWADGQPEEGPLHADFQLENTGEGIGLFAGNGSTLIDSVIYSQQVTNVSFGRYPNAGDNWRFYGSPTAGAENTGMVYLGLVAEPEFSVRRGFYEEAFDVVLTCPTPVVRIRYTLDSTDPTEASALYTGTPIAVSSTTCLRAAAFKTGYLPSAAVTHTYIFVDDVIEQPEMVTDITQDPVWGPQIHDALLEIPTISLVTPYTIPDYPIQSPPEVPVSIEMIFPDGSEGFQANACAERYGGIYTVWPKQALRISFKSIYGPSRLEFDLFGDTPYGGDDATDSFNQIILRNGSHDSLFYGGYTSKGVYTRGRYCYDRQIEMGHLSLRGKFVHVYLNGVYWGQYDLMERPTADFMATYLGGDEEDYDIMKGRGGIFCAEGDSAAWDYLVANTDNYEIVQEYMDVDNYIDYMLLNFYGANDHDWYSMHNWVAGRRREPGGKFMFFMWDNDFLFRSLDYNTVDDNGGPGYMLASLAQHEEFRMRLADRAQKLFFNDGMLTPARVQADFTELTSRVERTVIPECARWSEVAKSAVYNEYPPDFTYTPDTLQQSVNWIKYDWGNVQSDRVIQQMRDGHEGISLFPSIDAPTFSQHGGEIAPAVPVSMTAPAGVIWYTTDGEDPRVSTGDGILKLVDSQTPMQVLVPTDDSLELGWTFPGFPIGPSWTTGTSGIGFDVTAVDGFDSEPVAHWPFDELDGPTAFDATGNNYDGTLYGDPARVTGHVGSGALQFDGSNYVSCGVEPGSAEDLTFSLWIKPSSEQAGRPLSKISEGSDPGSGYAVMLRPESGNPYWNKAAIVRIGADKNYGGWGNECMASKAYEPGMWSHLLYTFDSVTATGKIYVNGLCAGTKVGADHTLNGVANTQDDLWIGKGWSEPYVGVIDDVAVWDMVLPEYEIITIASGEPAYKSLIETDIESQMHDTNASVYIRIPFNVNDLSKIDRLSLKVKYDDGFVAYLNGQKVAERNAPASVEWNSSATGEHPISQAWFFEAINISAHIGKLFSGNNVLAVHGLNINKNDDDFLMCIELETGNIPGNVSGSAIKYTGPISFSESTHLKARVLVGDTWSALNEAVFAMGPVVENLRITEIMYHPADPNAEYIELKNIGVDPINIGLARFTNGIEFTFPSHELAAGEYVLVAQSPAELVAAAPSIPPGVGILGPYTGQINDGGEKIKLVDAIGRTIHKFDYKDGWYEITDGGGFSLTIKDPTSGDLTSWDEKAGWRPSASIGGSPGEDDTGQVPELGAIKINELLAHSDVVYAYDWIELYNTTGTAINIGGWYLSDDNDNLKKYTIPDGTSIGAYDYCVFYENLHFGVGNPADPANVPFALSGNGETLYLNSGQGGVLTGYSEEEAFDASETDVPFGRYEKSTGAFNFVAMSSPTPGSANAYPKVGPVVISEIMYNPLTEGDAEYVELLNISGSTILLQEWDSVHGIYVPWQFTDEGGITFNLPLIPIDAGERILLVKNKTIFETEFTDVPSGVRIFAWGEGKLDNGGERIEISRPGDLEGLTRYYIRVDRVNYDDDPPWPSGPDGGGNSLTRIVSSDYGNDVANWRSETPTPGE